MMDSSLTDLLAPLAGETSCGEDLSFSPDFDRIQEARREDDPTVDYGEWQTALKQADWQEVISCCTELLRMRSKDLRVAAWLTEGLVKTRGIAGLGEGAALVAGLLTRFGEHVHPQADSGDQEQRIGTITWFVTRMTQLVRQIPLTQAKEGRFSLSDHDTARQAQMQIQRNPDAAAGLDDKVTLEKI